MRGHLRLDVSTAFLEFRQFALDGGHPLGYLVEFLAAQLVCLGLGLVGIRLLAVVRGGGATLGTRAALPAIAGAENRRPIAVFPSLFDHIKVVADAAGQMPDFTANQRELLVGDTLQQVPIVRYDNQRARPSVEQILHHREHVGVQVVARLVEDENIGLVKQN